MNETLKRVARRFARAFVAGGVASVATFIAAGTPVTEFKDINNLAFPLFMAFLSGGIMALDKLLRDAPNQ